MGRRTARRPTGARCCPSPTAGRPGGPGGPGAGREVVLSGGVPPAGSARPPGQGLVPPISVHDGRWTLFADPDRDRWRLFDHRTRPGPGDRPAAPPGGGGPEAPRGPGGDARRTGRGRRAAPGLRRAAPGRTAAGGAGGAGGGGRPAAPLRAVPNELLFSSPAHAVAGRETGGPPCAEVRDEADELTSRGDGTGARRGPGTAPDAPARPDGASPAAAARAACSAPGLGPGGARRPALPAGHGRGVVQRLGRAHRAGDGGAGDPRPSRALPADHAQPGAEQQHPGAAGRRGAGGTAPSLVYLGAAQVVTAVRGGPGPGPGRPRQAVGAHPDRRLLPGGAQPAPLEGQAVGAAGHRLRQHLLLARGPPGAGGRPAAPHHVRAVAGRLPAG